MKRILDRVKNIRFITVKGKEYDLFDEIGITDELDVIFKEHSEKMLFWGRLLTVERGRQRKLEDELKHVEADMFTNYWDGLENTDRNFSDTLVWAYVNSCDDVSEKRKEVRLARKKVEDLKVVCDAFEHRRSSLMQLGALHRRESETLSTRRKDHG